MATTRKKKLPTIIIYSGLTELVNQRVTPGKALVYANETGYTLVVTKAIIRCEGFVDMKINMAWGSGTTLPPNEKLVVETDDILI